MKILAVGGGSGGHVTPLVAVLSELKQEVKNPEIRVWCDAPFYARTQETVHSFDTRIRVQKVVSGKLRRFYDLPLWRHLLRVRTIVLPNIIDSVKVVIGIIQSLFRLVVWRPDVVFCKGGFVSLPVGIAARLLRIPVVLHDSDTHPGLANRLLARWATAIGTGASIDHYGYAASKTHYVGIPIKSVFYSYKTADKTQLKNELGFGATKPLVVVTGGGLGAKPVNDAVVAVLPGLLKEANVLLISGDTQYAELSKQLAPFDSPEHFQLHPFLGDTMPKALAAADIVVARAGATTLLELAAVGAPTVLIPNPNLPGGHQVKNAKPYHEKDAVKLLDEVELQRNPDSLEAALLDLLGDEKRQTAMSHAIHEFAQPDAAKDMVQLILEAAGKRGADQ